MTHARVSLAGPKIAFIGAICALAPVSARAAADIVEQLTDRWYAIEAVVFQRTGSAAASNGEYLAGSGSRSYPHGIRTITPHPAADAYLLGPYSLATLEFPVLSFNCAGAGTSAPYRPPGIVAWYLPALPGTDDRAGRSGTGAPAGPAGNPIDAGQAGPGPVRPPPAAPAPAVNAESSVVDAPVPTATPPPGALPFRHCGPAGKQTEDSTAAAGACPPAPFDIPLAPGQPPRPCARLPGEPPPSIAPMLAPHPLLEWLSAIRRFETRLRQDSYQVSTRGASLAPEANRIRNAPALQVLWHGRWTQPVPARGEPQPLLIQAGRRNQGVYELEGVFDVTLGRYLHFHARLWLRSAQGEGRSAQGEGRSAQGEGRSAQGEGRSAQGEGITGQESFSQSVARVEPSTGGQAALSPAAQPAAYMLLEESRAMRSGALHYLDHPGLGILVRADPVEPPDWLVDASAAFHSAELVN